MYGAQTFMVTALVQKLPFIYGKNKIFYTIIMHATAIAAQDQDLALSEIR